MWNTIKYQLPSIFWAFIVVILCSIPPTSFQSTPTFEGMDKLVHTGFFFVLTVLLFYGKIRQQKSYSYRTTTILKILLLTTFIGGGIEIVQWKIFISRSADWWDFFADMIGTGMGIFSYIFLHIKQYHEDE